MKDTQHNQTEDDFEAEVTDILDSDTATDGNLVPIPLTLRSRFSPRQRAFQGAITAGVVMLALLIIISGYIPARNIVALSLDSLVPVPTPTLVPDAGLFYIQRTLSWSSVSLDGHVLSRLPAISSDAPLQLARGSHWFVWRADPFEPISCTISVPAASTDTCLPDSIARAPSGERDTTIYVRVITFVPSLNTLSVVLRTALIQTAQESLDTLQSSEPVQPGEHFFDAQSLIDTATQPLRATLGFQLDTDARFLLPCKLPVIGKPCSKRLIQDCRLFCTKLVQASALGEKTWDVFASIRSSWEYTTTDGRIIAQSQPDALVEHIISLHITWDGTQWHVTVLPYTSIPGGLTCILARDKINLNTSYHFAAGDFSKLVDWQFASGPNPASGCLAVATLEQNTVVPRFIAGNSLFIAGNSLALCLYRFGVLLAVNDTAHVDWPLMPLADAYEQSLAQHIAALLPTINRGTT